MEKVSLESAIEKMPGVWKTVWTSLHQKYRIKIDEYEYLGVARPVTIQGGHKVTRFWSMFTDQAKKKGWDWWGDTGVSVDQIVGPTTFEEVF